MFVCTYHCTCTCTFIRYLIVSLLPSLPLPLSLSLSLSVSLSVSLSHSLSLSPSLSLGLHVLCSLLQKFSICEGETSVEFFKAYFLELMQHVFAVVTDTSHTASQWYYIYIVS